jgi:hypothetical protein
MARADVPRPEVFWMSGWGEWETLYFYIVLIRGGDIVALVNTRPPQDLDILNEHWHEFAGTRARELRDTRENVEARRPRTARYHTRSAHSSSALFDCKHRLVPECANLHIVPGVDRGYSGAPALDTCSSKILHFRHDPQVSSVRSQSSPEIARRRGRNLPGILASWVGTHHRSSMLYSISTAKGTVGISDCAFKYGNVEGQPLGIGESLEEGYRAYSRIRREIQHFIPLYDPEVLTKYPGGVVA